MKRAIVRPPHGTLSLLGEGGNIPLASKRVFGELSWGVSQESSELRNHGELVSDSHSGNLENQRQGD